MQVVSGGGFACCVARRTHSQLAPGGRDDESFRVVACTTRGTPPVDRSRSSTKAPGLTRSTEAGIVGSAKKVTASTNDRLKIMVTLLKV